MRQRIIKKRVSAQATRTLVKNHWKTRMRSKLWFFPQQPLHSISQDMTEQYSLSEHIQRHGGGRGWEMLSAMRGKLWEANRKEERDAAFEYVNSFTYIPVHLGVGEQLSRQDFLPSSKSTEPMNFSIRKFISNSLFKRPLCTTWTVASLVVDFP